MKPPELKKILRFHGLAFRYGFYILTGIFIIFLGAFIYTYTFSYKILLADAQQNAMNVTNLTTLKILNILQPVEDVPKLIAKKLEDPETDFKSALKTIQDFVAGNKEVYGGCIAFEPYQYDKKFYYYAPYFCEKNNVIISKMLGSEDYNYFQQEWYTVPQRINAPVWSEPYFDRGGGEMLMCTYSVPFYRNTNHGKTFTGVVTMDISLTSLREIVDTIHVYKSGFGFLISRSGKIITFPDSSKTEKDIRDIARNVEDTNVMNATLKMMKGESGFVRLQSIREPQPSWMYYSPVASTEWSFGLIIPSKELFASFFSFSVRLLIIFIASVIALMIIIVMITRRFTRPITQLVEVTRRIGQGDFRAPLPIYKAKDEIMQLSNSFSLMQEELQIYMEHLKETTSANEKLQSEMEVAHTIQMGLLPKTFPDRPDCRISALLEPVRAVGGDLYDFFISNDDQLYLAIGDVAGKGVPAALFMAVTKTLFRSTIGKGETISSTIEKMNRELSRENPNAMFVTFVAILFDLNTGIMEVCNAGHTQPIILRKDGSVEKITHLAGIPLGIDESISYSSIKIMLDPDDTVILYTDGITEAFNQGEQLYGEKSLISSLQGMEGRSGDIPAKIIGDVRRFRGEAEPSDDIAILVMKYTDHLTTLDISAGKHEKSGITDILHLKNHVHEIPGMIAKIDELITRWSVPAKAGRQIHLAMEELVSNIIFYAYPDKEDHVIEIEFSRTPEGLKIVTTDDGKPFDILNQADPADTELPAEERPVGGLGIHFIKKIMDEIGYSRINDRNQVTMIKKF